MIDVHEPVSIEGVASKVIPVVRLGLNQQGFADYLWNNSKGGFEQAERKRVDEILSNMEAVEQQLGKEVADCPQLNLLDNMLLMIEGVAEPVVGGVQTYVMATDGKFFRQSRLYKINYARYEGWVLGIERAGILVWRTSSWLGTAEALLRLYKSAQDGLESTALRRHVKSRPVFHPNPHVQTLMGISRARIGVELAERLIEAFGTAWNVLSQDEGTLASTVKGIGKERARTILRAVGKNED